MSLSQTAVSLQEHPEFLALLQDEGFLEEFKARPVETLGAYHIDLDPKSVPAKVRIPQYNAGSIVEADVFLGLI